VRQSDAEIGRLSGVGYNPAVEVRGVSKQDFEKIRSKTGRSDYALGETAEKIQARL